MGRAAAGVGGSAATLQSIRALPSLAPLSTAGIAVEIRALPAELELVLSKGEWKAPAVASIPLRHLRAGMQVNARVPPAPRRRALAKHTGSHPLPCARRTSRSACHASAKFA